MVGTLRIAFGFISGVRLKLDIVPKVGFARGFLMRPSAIETDLCHTFSRGTTG
ncbi:hypothetical protein PAXRUDRAFT_827238 [Paxillus rubicundulus Ve08.2h10]|uniref:Uncharacterized protein n=1 Tax=Paxillus rubicundulus Ve08.2h10 TaxID=930991 RepID=A0A0D0DYB9_9AGAM|nr:hypothetical protein PAXRUDRAFT_827238 [Paxillus rubicundulus Ve08.2h10]